MGDLGWDPRWKVDNNKKSEYRLYILDGIDVKFLVCFWCLQLTVKWMGHKKKKRYIYIFWSKCYKMFIAEFRWRDWLFILLFF